MRDLTQKQVLHPEKGTTTTTTTTAEAHLKHFL
jgi:hypothetical protein